MRVLPIDKEFMVIFSDIKQRWMMAFNRSLPSERRVFAFLEAVFMPVSFLTLITLAGLPVLGWCGVVVSGWFKGPLMTRDDAFKVRNLAFGLEQLERRI